MPPLRALNHRGRARKRSSIAAMFRKRNFRLLPSTSVKRASARRSAGRGRRSRRRSRRPRSPLGDAGQALAQQRQDGQGVGEMAPGDFGGVARGREIGFLVVLEDQAHVHAQLVPLRGLSSIPQPASWDLRPGSQSCINSSPRLAFAARDRPEEAGCPRASRRGCGRLGPGRGADLRELLAGLVGQAGDQKIIGPVRQQHRSRFFERPISRSSRSR